MCWMEEIVGDPGQGIASIDEVLQPPVDVEGRGGDVEMGEGETQDEDERVGRRRKREVGSGEGASGLNGALEEGSGHARRRLN